MTTAMAFLTSSNGFMILPSCFCVMFHLGMLRLERGEEPIGGRILRLIQIRLARLSLPKIKSDGQGNSAYARMAGVNSRKNRGRRPRLTARPGCQKKPGDSWLSRPRTEFVKIRKLHNQAHRITFSVLFPRIQLLESGVIAQRIPDRIESKKRRGDRRRAIQPAAVWYLQQPC